MAMDRVDSVPNEPFRGRIPERAGRVASIAFTVISVVLFLLVWRANFQRPDVSSLLLAALVLGICLVILFVADLSLHLRRGHRETAKVLETREREFKQMADNIEEIFWTIDAENKKAL
jgi:hypothetical protein